MKLIQLIVISIMLAITACQAPNTAKSTAQATLTNHSSTDSDPKNTATSITSLASTASRNPFQASKRETSMASEGLMAFPLSQLTAVGYLQDQHRQWLIINAPDQRSYPVTIGSRIGNQGDQIVAITADHFVLKNPQQATTITMPLLSTHILSQGEINP